MLTALTVLKHLVRALCWIIGLGGIGVAAWFLAQHLNDEATPLDNSTYARRTTGDSLAKDGLDPKLVISKDQADVLSGDSGRYFDHSYCTPKSGPGADGHYYRIRSCNFFNGKSAEEATRKDEQTLQVNTFVEPIKGQTKAYDARLSTAKLSSLSYEKEHSTHGQTYTPLDVATIPELKGVKKAFAETGRGLKNPSGITLNYGTITIQVWMQNGSIDDLLHAAETVTNNLR